MRRLILALLACACASAQTLTTVADNVILPNGTPANGTITLKWQQFLNAAHTTVVAGSLVVPVVNGAFTVNLYPNDTALPAGTCYAAAYRFQTVNNTVSWFVPTSSTPVNLNVVQANRQCATQQASTIAAAQITNSGATTGQVLTWTGQYWAPGNGGGGGGGNPPFSNILSGVNNAGAVMTVGNTSSLTFSGSGIVNANRLNGQSITLLGNTGVLMQANGGFTSGDLLSADPSSNITDSGIPGTSVIVSTGTYSNPSWITSLASSKLSGPLACGILPTLTGDATTAGGTCATTVLKTNGVAFAPSATTDTTNASNISVGTLAAARLPAINLALSGGGGGVTGNLQIGNFNGGIGASPTTCWFGDGTWKLCGGGSGGGTVTSVALAVPAWLTVSGSPITVAGTLAVTAATGQTAHKVIGTGSGTSFAPVTLATGDLPFTYSGNTTTLATTSGTLTNTHMAVFDASGNIVDGGAPSAGGTVTSFSAGTLSPLFTTSVATASTTPALSFTLSNANAHKFFGNNTGGSAAPGFQSIGTGDLPFTYSGNTTVLATTTGTLTNGHCVSIDASGNLVDFGGACGGGGGGGTVTNVGFAAPTGFTVTGSPVIASGTLTLAMPTGWTTGDILLGNGSNSVTRLPIGPSGSSLQSNGTTASWLTAGTVSSVGLSLPAQFAVTGTPVTTTGTLTATWNNAAAHTFFGNNTGSPATPAFVTIGTGDLPFSYTGNTTKLATSTGTITNGHCASWDSNGNIVDSGLLGCGGSGGTVTNTSGPLTAAHLVVGNNTNDITVLPSLGSANTTLHANPTGTPSFSLVVLTTDVSGILPGANGGTGNGFFAVSGPASSLKTFTFPNASATVLTTNAFVTPAQGGTGFDSSGVAKGGLITGSGAGTFNLTAVGTNGQVLTADSTAPGGVSWQAGGGGGSGTVTSIATTSPISGGTITTTGTISCPTCVTSAASLTANQLMIGSGSQGSQTLGTLGTTTTVLHGNSSGAPSYGNVVNNDIAAATIDLTTKVTNILPVPNGGTGVATITGPIKGNGASAFSAAAASDIVGLFLACSGTAYLGADGSCHPATNVITVKVGGTTINTEPAINFVSSSTITQVCADNPGVAINCTPAVNTANVPTINAVQAGAPIYCHSTNGTTTATCSLANSGSHALTAYTQGMLVSFQTDTTMASSGTLNIDTLGAISVLKVDCSTAIGGQIVANHMYVLAYNGSSFCLVSQPN